MFDLVFVLSLLLAGEFTPSELIYSVHSLVSTGVVLEDSVFWDCATMGNRVCG